MLTTVFIALVILFPLSTPAAAKHKKHPKVRPVVFVHGSGGCATQFESQAMRFASNGYPADYLAAFEYSTPDWYSDFLYGSLFADIDAFIASVLDETGAEQVDLVGHSLGVWILHQFLASPERAVKVAHYVCIDGTSSPAPDGVDTLAIWRGLRSSTPDMDGAEDVAIPGTPHIEVASSAGAFYELYRFFNDKDPETMAIEPEPRGKVRLAGRVIVYSYNLGVENANLEIWEVDRYTGARKGKKPKAEYSIGEDGSWGPFKAKGDKHYEFTVMHADYKTHHFYYEPFARSDYFVRFSMLDSSIVEDQYVSEYHSFMKILRYKEFWGDPGTNSDILAINGANVMTDVLSPVSKNVAAVYITDEHADGLSDLTEPIDDFIAAAWRTGADLYLPAADPPDDTIRLVMMPRGSGGKWQMLNVRNWISSEHVIVPQFNDHDDHADYWVCPGGKKHSRRVVGRTQWLH